MHRHVTFWYPAPFVRLSEEDGVLSVDGAQRFVSLLKRIPGLQVDDELCQEDWGVVIFARRARKQFWIGLSGFDEHEWAAHIHHGSFAWLQRMSPSGKRAMEQLILDIHAVLANEPAVSKITWHPQTEAGKQNPRGSPTPQGA